MGDNMKPPIIITLIMCGTVVAALPIVSYRIGWQLADLGFRCYMGLAATMVLSGIIGSFMRPRFDSLPGFEPVAVSRSSAAA